MRLVSGWSGCGQSRSNIFLLNPHENEHATRRAGGYQEDPRMGARDSNRPVGTQ